MMKRWRFYMTDDSDIEITGNVVVDCQRDDKHNEMRFILKEDGKRKDVIIKLDKVVHMVFDYVAGEDYSEKKSSRVVEIDSILSSLKNIRKNGMGKRLSLDTLEEYIINNSFEIGIEASEARAVVTESGTVDRFELFLNPSDLLLIIKSLSRYGELPRKNKMDVVHAQVLADTLGDFYTVQERKNYE